MDELKKWIPELLLDTIVAIVVTFISYLVGFEKTWAEAQQTFLIAFAIMFILGIYNRKKHKK